MPLVFRNGNNLANKNVSGAGNQSENSAQLYDNNDLLNKNDGLNANILSENNDEVQNIDSQNSTEQNFGNGFEISVESGEDTQPISNTEAFYSKMNEIYYCLLNFNNFGMLAGLYEGEFKKNLTKNFSDEDFVLGLTYAKNALAVYQAEIDLTPDGQAANIYNVENNDESIFIIEQLYSLIADRAMQS